MSIHRLNLYSFVVTVLLLTVVCIWPVLLAYSSWYFLAMLVLVGIPHGAADHLLHWKGKVVSPDEKQKFYLKYIGLIGAFTILWFLMPDLAFVIFLLVSSFHFGQSQLYYLKLPRWFRFPMFTAWGILLLSIITYFNYEECLKIFDSLAGIQVNRWLPAEALMYLAAISSIAILAGMVNNRQPVSVRNILTEIICLFLFIVSARFTNAVFSFTIYFGIWHSLRSLVIEYNDIRHVFLNARGFIRSLLPFTFLALAGMACSYILLVNFFPEISPYMVFIILISGLTLPHFIIMHEVYENADH